MDKIKHITHIIPATCYSCFFNVGSVRFIKMLRHEGVIRKDRTYCYISPYPSRS